MLPNVESEEVSLREYLRVREASELLGIHPDTLRRWEKLGRLPTYRHPINRYRLYRRIDIENFLREILFP